MNDFLLSLYWLIGAAILLVPSLLLLKRPSGESDRILTLVQSVREDERELSWPAFMRLTVVKLLRSLRKWSRLEGISPWAKRLVGAGLRSSSAEEIFFAAQCGGVLVGGFLGAIFSGSSILAIAAGAIFGFLVPGMWLTMRRRKRCGKIRRSVPDMVDLLVVCVGAGLGIDQALLRVGEDLQLSHPEITQELGRVSLERQAGTPRIDAWQALAERVEVEELFAFTSMLAETDRFGTPITKALSEFAEDLRLKRRQRAEEAAAKTKIKIIFPLVLCIFPCIFVVLLLPALLSLVGNFNGINQ